jgi:hypothetical protein
MVDWSPGASNKKLWVVENFYSNPDSIRAHALAVPYIEGGLGRGFIGRRTQSQYLWPGLKERFESIMGIKIREWESHGMNGRFQMCYAGQPPVYHCDAQQWAGMIYLTPNAPFHTGTNLLAHKATGARSYHDPRFNEVFPDENFLDGTPFEDVDKAGNVYNRLVIFDASSIHCAGGYFGNNPQNTRLWQMFFFD